MPGIHPVGQPYASQQRIGRKVRDAIRDHWLEHRSISATCNQFKISDRTFRRLCSKFDWTTDAAKIDSMAGAIALEKFAAQRAELLVATNEILAKMVRDMRDQDKIKFNALRFDKLTRLREFLGGNPDARLDMGDGPRTPKRIIEDIRTLNNDELTEFRRLLRAERVQSTP